ncbi:MAG TPA: FAD-dependent thymidylate synthase [Acidimicrobiales bacterium]|nr:FAD-dependent thymidylate synthase [Acidimicrobiales bacterium]
MSRHAPDVPYASETWTPAEADILRRYFTNLEGPVFALVNLPEVVKGALFARYSRSAKSLRRLFLDEFVGDLDVSGDHSVDATVGLARAEDLYERVFFEYGDDSVAQLGGVHLACEQASNLLTKVLERGRLMSYMEKSTRYVAYDTRLPSGRYRYYRSPEILASPLGARYVGDMDRMFDAYAQLLPALYEWFAQRHPKAEGVSDFAHRRAVKAKAFDTLRGLLPSAATSNLGIYGSGQGYEALLLRMRAHPLPEARDYAGLMLIELRKVIPSWVRRVDVADRGSAWSAYMEKNNSAMADLTQGIIGEVPRTPAHLGAGAGPDVKLVDWEPDAEVKLVTAMLYPYTHLGEEELALRVSQMTGPERQEIMRKYAGDRANRRHRPGRALERCSYRFDVVSDYGAFRDLQRHRLLTIEWQGLTPFLGYSMPEAVVAAGGAEVYEEAMNRSAGLYEVLGDQFGSTVAAYAVTLGHRVRYSVQMNVREAMHMLELRTTPEGHPEYRKVCQKMHDLIADQAGHRSVAAMMGFVDHRDYEEDGLGRLGAERRAEARRRHQHR